MTPEEIAVLEQQKAALKKAMRSGALIVSHGDKRVQYRSISEMQTALAGINAELVEAETGKARRRVIYVRAERGY